MFKECDVCYDIVRLTRGVGARSADDRGRGRGKEFNRTTGARRGEFKALHVVRHTNNYNTITSTTVRFVGGRARTRCGGRRRRRRLRVGERERARN